jgi:hypothetical protein
MKKIRRDKPIRVIIHIYMENHKETPCLASYLYFKQAKTSFSPSFIFFLQNQRTGGQNGSCRGGRGWYQWEGGGGGKKG